MDSSGKPVLRDIDIQIIIRDLIKAGNKINSPSPHEFFQTKI